MSFDEGLVVGYALGRKRGGGGKVTPLSVTQNGTYTAGMGDYAGFTGFNPVNVNVMSENDIFEDIVKNTKPVITIKIDDTYKFVLGFYLTNFPQIESADEINRYLIAEKISDGMYRDETFYWYKTRLYSVSMLYKGETALCAKIQYTREFSTYYSSVSIGSEDKYYHCMYQNQKVEPLLSEISYLGDYNLVAHYGGSGFFYYPNYSNCSLLSSDGTTTSCPRYFTVSVPCLAKSYVPDPNAETGENGYYTEPPKIILNSSVSGTQAVELYTDVFLAGSDTTVIQCFTNLSSDGLMDLNHEIMNAICKVAGISVCTEHIRPTLLLPDE